MKCLPRILPIALVVLATPAFAQDFQESFYLAPIASDAATEQVCHAAFRSQLLRTGALVERSSPEISTLMTECTTEISSPSFSQECLLAVANTQVDLLFTFSMSEVYDEHWLLETTAWRPALNAGVWSESVILEAEEPVEAALDSCGELARVFAASLGSEFSEAVYVPDDRAEADASCGARLISARDGRTTSRWWYAYDDEGRRVEETFDANGDGRSDSIVRTRYDSAGRISEVDEDWDGDGRADASRTYTYEGGTLSAVRFDHDGDGNIDTIHEYVTGADGRVATIGIDTDLDGDADETRRHQYDSRGNLTRVDVEQNGAHVGRWEYTWDSTDRQLTATWDGDGDGRPNDRWTYRYEDGAEAGYSYDRGDDGTVDERFEVLRECEAL